jgi:uncharacterized protein (DUF433 family)
MLGRLVKELGGYRVSEAARYAETSAATVARWFRGYEAPGHRMAPVLGRRTGGALAGEGGLLSYLELVEVAFVADFRRLGMALERLRQAHDYLRTTFGVAHPFAEVRFRSDGAHLLAPFGQALVAADAGGQLAWATPIAARLEQFDYADGTVCRWYPRGRAGSIAIDPRVGLGAPVVDGTGLPTWVVRDRRRAAESVEAIADDLGLTPAQVEAALAFERSA